MSFNYYNTNTFKRNFFLLLLYYFQYHYYLNFLFVFFYFLFSFSFWFIYSIFNKIFIYIVHYLKTENKISIFEKLIFTEEQRINLSYIYSFESGFDLEKIGYEHMIKHKINKKENE